MRRLFAVRLLSLTAVFATACSLLVDSGGLAGTAEAPGADDALAPFEGSVDGPSVDGSSGGIDSPADVTADSPASDTYRDAVLADGPIAYFRLEEAIGGGACKNEIASSTVSCILPSSATTPGAGGITAKTRSLRFDAAAARLNVFGATTFSGEQPFTIEAWFFLDGPAAGQVLFDNTDGPPPLRTGQVLYGMPDSTLQSEAWSSGTHLLYGHTLTPFPVGTWAHVVLLYSSVLQKDLLYVNGQAADAQRLAAGARGAATAALMFGGFVGQVDEVAIYPTALTPERIAAHIAAR